MGPLTVRGLPGMKNTPFALTSRTLGVYLHGMIAPAAKVPQATSLVKPPRPHMTCYSCGSLVWSHPLFTDCMNGPDGNDPDVVERTVVSKEAARRRRSRARKKAHDEAKAAAG